MDDRVRGDRREETKLHNCQIVKLYNGGSSEESSLDFPSDAEFFAEVPQRHVFLLYPTSDPTMQRMLFSLLERRSEARHSTIVCSQRNPEAWAKMLGDDAMAGAITSRATRGYVLRIDLKTETI